MISIVAPMAGFIISCVPPLSQSMMSIRMAMLVPAMLSNLLFISVMSKPKELLEVRKLTVICPKCGRPLSEYDLNNRRCTICKAQ